MNIFSKSIKKWFVVLLTFAYFFSSGFVFFDKQNASFNRMYIQKTISKSTKGIDNLFSQSAVLMDGDSGRILYEKDGYTRKPNASTTKILTCIIVLESCDLNEIVQVSAYASKMPDVQLNINQDEKYKVEDLLYSLMLESHNDTAVALAEHVAGSVEKFSILMNNKAKSIGCLNSYFITPNGLDSKDNLSFHGTTAADLARIMRYIIKNSPKSKEYLKITREKSYTFSDYSGKRSFTVNNHNAFLDMMEGALTGKTGFTGDAGYCYVGAVKRDGHIFIVALLACGWPNNKTYKWKDTKKLMNYAFENYKKEQCIKVNVKDKSIPIIYGNREEDVCNARLYCDYERKVLLNNKETVSYKYNIVSCLYAPTRNNMVVGYVEIYINDKLFDAAPIYIRDTVKTVDFMTNYKKIFRKFVTFSL